VMVAVAATARLPVQLRVDPPTVALPAVAATSQDVVPPHLKGLSWGAAMVSLLLLGGAWGPLLVGGISDRFAGGYQGLALGLAVTGLFGFIASWVWFITARHVDSDMRRAPSLGSPVLTPEGIATAEGSKLAVEHP